MVLTNEGQSRMERKGLTVCTATVVAARTRAIGTFGDVEVSRVQRPSEWEMVALVKRAWIAST